jgi:hypothetical protein
MGTKKAGTFVPAFWIPSPEALPVLAQEKQVQ